MGQSLTTLGAFAGSLLITDVAMTVAGVWGELGAGSFQGSQMFVDILFNYPVVGLLIAFFVIGAYAADRTRA